MPFKSDPLYRSGVGMMIVNADNKIFMGQRADHEEAAWQMPQGGILPREDPDQAILRELCEEIGTQDIDIIVKSERWYQYDLPSHLATRSWGGQYKGQQQLWYALRFRGADTDINIHTPQPEFQKWRWVEPEEMLTLVAPFKKDVYTQVLGELWPYVIKS